MNKKVFIFGPITAILLGITIYFTLLEIGKTSPPNVNSFGECVSAFYPVLETYPRRCKTPDGRTFTEDVGNEVEKYDLIRVSNPRSYQVVQGPIIIKGEARGYWFFEASFPIELFDWDGNLLGVALARAKKDWMTEDFVPFEAELDFDPSTIKKGLLVLEKDNPSGLPENADELRIPVIFRANTETKILEQ